MPTNLEQTILRNLLTDENYMRKVLPFIKPDYFEGIYRILFREAGKFVAKYNKLNMCMNYRSTSTSGFESDDQGSRKRKRYTSMKNVLMKHRTRIIRGSIHKVFYKGGLKDASSSKDIVGSSFFTAIYDLFRSGKVALPCVIMAQHADPLILFDRFLTIKGCNICRPPTILSSKSNHGANFLIDRFNKGRYDLLLCTRGFTGTGLNLTGRKGRFCKNIIFLDRAVSRAELLQNRGRICRPLVQEGVKSWSSFHIEVKDDSFCNRIYELQESTKRLYLSDEK